MTIGEVIKRKDYETFQKLVKFKYIYQNKKKEEIKNEKKKV